MMGLRKVCHVEVGVVEGTGKDFEVHVYWLYLVLVFHSPVKRYKLEVLVNVFISKYINQPSSKDTFLYC